MLGISLVLAWPLSPDNFLFGLQWGVFTGGIGAASTCLYLATNGKRPWLAVLVGSIACLFFSCTSLWINVVSSLA